MTNEEAIKILKGIEMVGGSLPEDGDLVEEALLTGIKALEQKSYKSDARRWKRRYLDLKQRIFKLEEQTRWIPFSERLPKLYEKVLVTVNTEVSIGWREEDGWRIVDYISLEKYADSWIRGWMPMIEAYIAESEDKE